jgi:hypothetical protein
MDWNHQDYKRSENLFDYQVIRIIKLSQEQPDLEILVRLFLDTFSKHAGKFINPSAYFRILLATNDEIVIGSNHWNFEVRIYFMQHKESAGEVFIIFTMNSFNWMGRLKSIYVYPLIKTIIRVMIRVLRKRYS